MRLIDADTVLYALVEEAIDWSKWDDSTFKSTYQIIEELSEKWNDLTDISRANITELIAGKRRGGTE